MAMTNQELLKEVKQELAIVQNNIDSFLATIRLRLEDIQKIMTDDRVIEALSKALDSGNDPSITTLKIWKVQHGMSEHHTYFTYSFQGQSTPVILNEDQFKALFPSIDPGSVPVAPATSMIEIEARVR